MKLKLFIGVLIASLAVVALFSQVKMINQAEAVDANPVTAPITYFKVSGKIVYNLLGKFIPAQNVRVSAIDTQDRSITDARTDINGLYNLTLRQAEYIISAQDLFRKTIFAPVHYKLFVTSDLSKINFVGILN